MNKFKWEDLNLSENDLEEVQQMIEDEKNPENVLKYEEIEKQIISSLDLDCSRQYKAKCNIIDHKREITYELLTHQAKISGRFSIGLRNTVEENFLLRIDYGNTLRHTNNKGKNNEYLVLGAHIHLIAPNDKHSIKNVIPIECVKEFKNIYTIAEVFAKFTDITNIVKED